MNISDISGTSLNSGASSHPSVIPISVSSPVVTITKMTPTTVPCRGHWRKPYIRAKLM